MKKLNEKCLACAQSIFNPHRSSKKRREGYHYNKQNNKWYLDIVPECYDVKKCRRMRWYYKNLEGNRQKQREGHRYLKHKKDACALCQSRKELRAHHIVPQMDGGLDIQRNIMTVCHACHENIHRYLDYIKLNPPYDELPY